MKSLKNISLIAILLLITGCSTVNFQEKPSPDKPVIVMDEGKSLSSLWDGPERETVIVKRVIDTDTFRFVSEKNTDKEYTARMISINGPEITKGKNEKYGEEGKEYLEKLILGKKIELELDPAASKTDNYGRYLVHTFIDEQYIQELLVKNGFARIAYTFGDYQYVDRLEKVENESKQEGKNIWEYPGYVSKTNNGFNMDIFSKQNLFTTLRR